MKNWTQNIRGQIILIRSFKSQGGSQIWKLKKDTGKLLGYSREVLGILMYAVIIMKTHNDLFLLLLLFFLIV